MEREIFIIYVKKSASDTVFDYETTASNWEECTEILKNIVKVYNSVKYLHIVEGKEVFERTFDFKGKFNKTTLHKKMGGVIPFK